MPQRLKLVAVARFQLEYRAAGDFRLTFEGSFEKVSF